MSNTPHDPNLGNPNASNPAAPNPSAPNLGAGSVATEAAPVEQHAPSQYVQGYQRPDVAPEPHIEYIDPRDYVRLPRRSGPFRRLAIVAVLLGFAGFYVAGIVDDWAADQVVPSGPVGSEIEFLISEGEGTNTTAQNLAGANVISNPTIFRYWLRCSSAVKRLLECEETQEVSWQAGKYLLNTNMSFQDVVDELNLGSIPPQNFSVTIPEGLTVDQIIDRLIAENSKYASEDFRSELNNLQVESRFLPEDLDARALAAGYRTPYEGLLFPSTYEVAEDAALSELSILRNMARTMEGQFDIAKNEAGGTLPPVAGTEGLNLTDYDMIVIASLIEEEAKIDADRPKIARVIYNRLVRGEALGIDASTRYAVDKRPGDPLLESDLASDSPYNTRNLNNVGLPPTPIAAPGLASLRAALAPAEGDWFFYVLTDEGGVAGAHTFATTNAEFQAAKEICRELGYC